MKVNENIFRFLIKIISIILFVSIQIFAQNEQIEFERHSNTGPIECIYQDSKGYLWIAGWGGLLRYDGYNFNIIESDGIGFLSTIYEDRSGNIWVGGMIGLGKFDPITETFTRYKPNPHGPEKEWSNLILSILEDKEGILWVGTFDGLNIFDRKTLEFTCIRHDSTSAGSLSDNAVKVIYEDKRGQLWFGTRNGLNKFDRETKQFTHYFNITSGQKEFGYWISSIYEDTEGMIWLGHNYGLIKFDQRLNTSTLFTNDPKNPNSPASNEINSICEDLSGKLWIAYKFSGVDVFDKSTEVFKHYTYDSNNLSSLNSDETNSVLCEQSGTVWVATMRGLNKLNRTVQPFVRISKDNIRQIINRRNGILYFKTDQGFKKYDNKTGQITTASLGGDLMYVDNDNNLWLNKYGGGLYKQDTSGRITKFYSSDQSEFKFWVVHIYESPEGVIWIGTSNDGLFFIDPVTQYVTRFNKTRYFINIVYEDSYGLLWVGTANGGLLRYSKDREIVTNYIFESEDSSSVSFTTILDIHEDKERNLWFASNTGLNKYDRSTNKFRLLSGKSGQSSYGAFAILEDDHGKLWLSNPQGVSKYDPETNMFRNYDASDGIPENGLSTIIGYKNENGEMFFGGEEGIIQFHPVRIKDNLFVPPIVINTFKIFNEDVKLDTAINRKKQINLNYSENSISFEFAALNFVSPTKNQYAYKLEGMENNWIYSEDRRYASYSNLDPGEYVFRVKGSNNDGVWNEEGTSIAIIISPPFWKTWWAYSSYAILFILTLYWIRRYELNRTGLKNKIKMDETVLRERVETDKMKSRFFANISHEFRTPLTLILGPAEKIFSKTSDNIIKDADIIRRNSRRLLQLINQLLDLSKLEAGKLKLEASRGNIVSFVKGVALSFESLAESKDIILKLLPEKEFIDLYFDKEKMMKILTNILSNAFKFTPEEGKITVSVRECHSEPARPAGGLVSESLVVSKMLKQVQHDKIKGFVEIKIRDTGIGIAQEEIPKLFDRFYQVDSSHTREYEGTGIGLALTKELVELHHGIIRVESEKAIFTEFTLEFPLGKDHLKDEEVVEKDEKTFETKILVSEEKYSVSDQSLAAENSLTELRNGESEDKTIILVVEDNYDMREYIKESLDGDYLIEEAMNGEQGVRKAEKIIPDLIISDMMMPKMDGNELVRILKNDEKTSHIPIILLTAKAGHEDKLEGLGVGADDYLTKPFDIKELQVRIKNLINIRKKLQEKFSKIGSRTSEINEKKLNSIDEKFMLRVGEAIEKHISEEVFNIEKFCREVGDEQISFS
ncbi:MAG: two-component regulator propeller domain-containing protein [Ignavibacteriaceae bacterium]|nr:two-component regulator propeller domain-containing protein [Ignavibacteriaceae bacterium]